MVKIKKQKAQKCVSCKESQNFKIIKAIKINYLKERIDADSLKEDQKEFVKIIN